MNPSILLSLAAAAGLAVANLELPGPCPVTGDPVCLCEGSQETRVESREPEFAPAYSLPPTASLLAQCDQGVCRPRSRFTEPLPGKGYVTADDVRHWAEYSAVWRVPTPYEYSPSTAGQASSGTPDLAPPRQSPASSLQPTASDRSIVVKRTRNCCRGPGLVRNRHGEVRRPVRNLFARLFGRR